LGEAENNLDPRAVLSAQARVDAREKMSLDSLLVKGRRADEQESFVHSSGLQGLEPCFEGERGDFLL
jgi:hypothetical protein